MKTEQEQKAQCFKDLAECKDELEAVLRKWKASITVETHYYDEGPMHQFDLNLDAVEGERAGVYKELGTELTGGE